MKHNERAVEAMARYLFDADPLNIEEQVSWEDLDEESLGSYYAYAIAVLDALVPPNKIPPQSLPATTRADIIAFGVKAVSILNGTADLGGGE